MDAIKTVDYRGYTIRIHQDQDPESPETWGNEDLFLITTRNRYFDVDRKGYDMNGCRDGIYKRDFHVIPLIAYIHSGVALSLGRNGQFADPWDSGQIGYILVKKRAGFRNIRKAAESLVAEWNDFLSGNVYGYTVTKDAEDEDSEPETTDMSCWGFYGDPDKYIIPQVKEEIDAQITQS